MENKELPSRAQHGTNDEPGVRNTIDEIIELVVQGEGTEIIDLDAERKRKKANQYKKRFATETESEKSHRLAKRAKYEREKRANETAAQKTKRLADLKKNNQERIANETKAQKAKRLADLKKNNQERIANETAAQKTKRLADFKKNNQERIANETAAQKTKRLADLKKNNQERIANETKARKAKRLADMSQYWQERGKANYNEQRQEAANANMQARVLRSRGTLYLGRSENFDENNVPEHNCGPMNVKCDFCRSLNFKDEKPQDGKFSKCCHKGKVNLETLTNFPEILKNLLTGIDQDSGNFMNNIRKYNSALAFASMGAQIKSPPGYGPYCFKINGQVYHNTSNLHPNDQTRKYAQLYILDPDEALKQRMNILENAGCLPELMKKLENLIREINPYAQAFKMMSELENEEIKRAQDADEQVQNIEMALIFDRQNDQRRYNAASNNEVALIFKNIDGEPPHDRDIRIHCRNEKKCIPLPYWNPNCDPMTYPLFFPYGEPGWRATINQQTYNRKVTLLQFYAYLLASRDYFNPLLNGGKLSQQFIVDAYAKAEANNLNYLRQNQTKLRADSYQGLKDYLEDTADNAGMKAGKAIILPSTFQNSPRNMHENCMDALSIVKKFGKPDLFITMTCNPNWIEIKENLGPGQRSEFRPDLVARVFKLKLNSLFDDIMNKHVLGFAVAKIHVIEFQKRGLPHAHLLVILRSADKPRTKEIIDQLVCAEIPLKESHPRLFDIVTKHMVHGPCGIKCMDNDGKCKKDFPVAFENETRENVNGYPHYKRRDLGPIEIDRQRGNTRTIDNSWIVPYNPYLLLKYNCHINVQICASIKSVKYLFKYVYKGYDCANVKTVNNVMNYDEISMFQDSRYISAPEAMWRLLEFEMHGRSHTIYKLALHLPNEQFITFRDGNEERALENSENKNSTLMAWFELNKIDPNANQYLYTEIPQHYVFNKTTKKWGTRIQNLLVIPRLYNVDIKMQELYYLRLMLLHVRGAKSFDDLKKYENIQHATFKLAAKARGLLDDNTIWEDTLIEAIETHSPAKLRQLFAVLCVFGSMKDPIKLWNKYKVEFFDRNIDQAMAEQLALRDINDVLILHDTSCKKIGLPKPKVPSNLNLQQFDQEIEANQGQIGLETLNLQQSTSMDIIMKSIDEYKTDLGNNQIKTSRCFFLDGPGGTGKTHLYKVILNIIRGRGDVAIVVASTGIAANLLPGGRTYHSQFKLPIPLLENSTSNLRHNSDQAKSLRKASIIIWDEATMAHKDALRAVHLLLSELMGNPTYPNSTELIPFGGKVILLGGDFRQCLPIVKHGNRTSIVEASIKRSPLWSKFQQLKLTQNMRANTTEVEFSKWLLKLGDGTLDQHEGLNDDTILIPQEHIIKDSLVNEIFGETFTLEQIDEFANRAILCPLNEDTIKINDDIVKRLNGVERSYYSIDSIDDADKSESDHFPVDFLNGLTPSGMPPHKLTLKIGAIIMLQRNLNTRLGLCNGTRLIVTSLKNNLIEAKVITGSATNQEIFIPRIELAPSDSNLPFILRRRQFPIRLAFAMTVNKSQGQTFDRVGIYLPQPCFSHGQLYVAFSRVRSKESAKIKIFENQQQGKQKDNSNDIFTRNPVYKEVFDN